MKVAIITAMQCEFDAVYSLYDFKGNSTEAEAKIYDKEVLLIKSGMGKVNAAYATTMAYQKGADLIINTGLAGGIDKSLRQGNIVLAEKVCYHDVDCGLGQMIGQVQDLPLYYESPTDIIKKISQACPDFKVGLTLTGDQFLTDVNRLKEIKENFIKGLAVDMESASVAQVCYLCQKPFLSLRIISDVVGIKEQEEQYKKFWDKLPQHAADMLDRVLKVL